MEEVELARTIPFPNPKKTVTQKEVLSNPEIIGFYRFIQRHRLRAKAYALLTEAMKKKLV